MNILFDTNIILDVFLERDPFFKNSAFLVDLTEKGVISGWLGATTVTTIYYLLRKEMGKERSDTIINSLFKIFSISPINRTVLQTAFEIDFHDYEDAVLHQAAFHSNLDGILTRNKKDFSKAQLSVYTPEELIEIMK